MRRLLIGLFSGVAFLAGAHAESAYTRYVHTAELMMGNVPTGAQVETYCYVANMERFHGQCAVPNDFGSFGSFWIDLDFSNFPEQIGPDFTHAREACLGKEIRSACKFQITGLYEERRADEWIIVKAFKRYD